MDIRELRSDEQDEAGAIVRRAYEAGGDYPDDYLDELADVAGRPEGTVVLVAEDDGRLVGCVTYVATVTSPYAEFDAADGAGIRMLGVDPAVHGRGVGPALTRACLARAAADGRGVIVLHTAQTESSATRMYDRLGFEPAPELDRTAPGVELTARCYWLDPVSLLVDARHGRRSLAPLADHLRPDTLAQGYALQDRLAERLGQATVGWKVGATNAPVQRALGLVEPFAGRLLADHVHRSPATLDLARYVHTPALECEIGLRLGNDLDQGPFTAASVAAAVAAVVPTIEIVETRFADRFAVGPASLMADNGVAADLVVGDDITDWQDLDLATVGLRLVVDGTEVAAGTGAEALGNPLESLAWLATHQLARGVPLRAGDLVSTGTCTGAVPAVAGSVAVNDAGPLGQVKVTWG